MRPGTGIHFTDRNSYFLYLQRSLEFLNQFLKLWTKIKKKHFYTPLLKIRNICAFTSRDFSLLHNNYGFLDIAEAYSEPCQTSEAKLFEEIVKVWKLVVIFVKSSILDVWHGSEYTSAYYKVCKLHWAYISHFF